MSETVKLIIEIPNHLYHVIKNKECTNKNVLTKAVENGIPLANDSERAEVQAYFEGEAYGWEQGRKALIDELEAEIADISTCVDYTAYKVKTRVLDILDNIGKKESEEV